MTRSFPDRRFADAVAAAGDDAGHSAAAPARQDLWNIPFVP